jgi:hypothetical protein
MNHLSLGIESFATWNRVDSALEKFFSAWENKFSNLETLRTHF